MLKSVKVPKSFEPIFEEAEAYISKYFSTLESNPQQGTISIGGERYILARGASLSVHFLDFLKAMYPSIDDAEALHAASIALFDTAHAIGIADAKRLHENIGIQDPIAKLSAGPILFAYMGWAFVDIHEESKPSPDENYFLIYDHHQSFEADSWIAHQKQSTICSCFMSAGYSSGWCEQSFGIPLVAREIRCRARGDTYCRFIMAQPSKIEQFIADYEQKSL